MRLLLAVDITQNPERLVERAADWAVRTGARLDLAYADPFARFGAPVLDAGLRDQLNKALAAERVRLRDRVDELVMTLPAACRGQGAVLEGVAHLEVTKKAAEEGYDAILVGRGATTLERLFLGSVAMRIMRNSPVHVVVLKVA